MVQILASFFLAFFSNISYCQNLQYNSQYDLAREYKSLSFNLKDINSIDNKAELEISMDIERSVNPVIITVAGLNFGKIGWGPFEFSNFRKLIDYLFPKNKSMSQIDDEQFEKFFLAEYSKYLLDQDIKKPEERRLPDDYLEAKVRELSNYNSDIVIIPFNWSRDPGDTKQTIPVFIEKLKEVYKTYGGKRPIIIVAHSWGSVLMHESLNRLAEKDNSAYFDKLITLGSPLVPSNFIVNLFLKLEIKKEDLLKKIQKPKNVGIWKNLWAERDLYSNTIDKADVNIQVDKDVEKLEPTLLDLILHNKLLRSIATNDFLKFRDIKAWHWSYMYDYDAYLQSINKEIKVEVFNPLVKPSVIEEGKF